MEMVSERCGFPPKKYHSNKWIVKKKYFWSAALQIQSNVDDVKFSNRLNGLIILNVDLDPIVQR